MSVLKQKTFRPKFTISSGAAIEDDSGQQRLRDRVRAAAIGRVREHTIVLDAGDSRSITLIERRANVTNRDYENGKVRLTLEAGDRQIERLRSAGVPVG